MNVLYITNLNIEKKGGLFNATYERIIRHNSNFKKLYILNNNSYDSNVMLFLKSILFKNSIKHYKRSDIDTYKGLTIVNLNYKRNLIYYIKKLIGLNKEEDSMAEKIYREHYEELIGLEIIHAHWGWPNGYIAYKLSKKLSVPYFITFHGSDLNFLDVKKEQKMRVAMENAYKCFFVSKELLNNAKKIGYQGANGVVTYNGVDLKKFNPKYKLKNQIKKVGFIGKLDSKKGADLLPDIFYEIAKKSKEKVEFIVVGGGPLAEQIKKSINEKYLNVKFAGNVEPDKIPDIMGSLDLLIVPSKQEGLGMVILEAQAMGIPVIGTDVGGIPEAIGNKKNLIKINEDLINNIAKRSLQILFEEYEVNVDLYRERICEKFNWSNIIEIENAYYMKSINDYFLDCNL